jgi:hypothetical protein
MTHHARCESFTYKCVHLLLVLCVRAHNLNIYFICDMAPITHSQVEFNMVNEPDFSGPFELEAGERRNKQ